MPRNSTPVRSIFARPRTIFLLILLFCAIALVMPAGAINAPTLAKRHLSSGKMRKKPKTKRANLMKKALRIEIARRKRTRSVRSARLSGTT
jgi:hypothetical protein